MSEPNRKPQKALHLYLDEDKKNPAHIGHTYHIFEKYDGWYMYIDCINGEWQEIRSRACRELDSMRAYTAMFKKVVPPTKVDCRVIFEACIYEEDGLPMVFSKLNGLFNQKKIALKKGATVESKTLGKVSIYHNVRLICHDLLIFGKEDRRFGDRYEDLKTFMRRVSEYNSQLLLTLNVAELIGHSKNPDNWKALYQCICRKYNNNGEGIIGKKSDAGYSYGKKNADVIKIKCEHTFELRVVGKVEGKDKYEGTLGKLIVEDANGIRNGVSGMSDAERDLWWNDFSLIKDKIVEVQCMKVLSNKSLREGRFKAVRYDKTEVDEL